MGKAEKDFAQLPISPLAGSSFLNFRKVAQGRNVETEYRKKFLLSKLVSFAMAPLQWWEKLRWGNRIKEYRMPEAPVFIIGHWRSGTTLLHNLLAQDPQFGYCTTYQNTFPNILLSHQWWFRPILKRMMPERRPSDGVLLGIDLPQEEGMGLGNTIPNTIYNTFYFPNDFREYLHKNIIRDKETQSDNELFMNGYRNFASKAMLNPIFRTRKEPIKRLLSKNPPHTARIDQLLKIYPEARFIYLHRDPYDTIASFRKFALGVFPGLQFHQFDMACYEDALIDLYKALRDKFNSSKGLIPEGHLIEVEYDDLIKEAMPTVERIYASLNISFSKSAEQGISKYVSEQKGHRAAGYQHHPEFIEKVDAKLKGTSNNSFLSKNSKNK